MKGQSGEAVCIGCGCSDSHACDHPVTGPCWWVKVDYVLGIGVCSECTEKIEEFEERVLKSRGIVPVTRHLDAVAVNGCKVSLETKR